MSKLHRHVFVMKSHVTKVVSLVKLADNLSGVSINLTKTLTFHSVGYSETPLFCRYVLYPLWNGTKLQTWQVLFRFSSFIPPIMHLHWNKSFTLLARDQWLCALLFMQWSRDTAFSTRLHVRPAKTQIRLCEDWLESFVTLGTKLQQEVFWFLDSPNA